MKKTKPKMAFCYDFDGTLSPGNMQEYDFIQKLNMPVQDFWLKAHHLSLEHDCDEVLSYMRLMLEEADARHMPFTREDFRASGAKISFYEGVDTWFDRINAYAAAKGIETEHYIISSGLREIIKGTSIAPFFKWIYASSFMYDEGGRALWPAQVINYTNKTQFLFRIEKGVLDVNDSKVNDVFSPEEMRIPFRNMVYIGDSDTDIPCMKLVTSNGGYSIGVYNAVSGDKAKVYKMMRDGRIKYFAPADYSEGTELDSLVKAIIDRTATNEILESAHYKCKSEYIAADRKSSEEGRRKSDLIIALENSDSFANTHSVISELREIERWEKEEAEMLFGIAVNNSQVFYILCDSDLKIFFSKLLKDTKSTSSNAQKVKEAIDKK